MTIDQLAEHINKTYGYQSPVPDTLVVDHETYANVCCHIVKGQLHYQEHNDMRMIYPLVAFGKHGGIFFKNIELILEGNEQ